MSKYIIEIDTANAAFEDDKAQEIAGILGTLAGKISSGRGFDHILRDYNGNKVGYAYFEDEEEDDSEPSLDEIHLDGDRDD